MITETTNGVPVIAISGYKNSGKTTLLTQIIPLLKKRGLRVGVLKHDAHGFEPDCKGRDSYLLREAGSELTLVFDPWRYMLIAECQNAKVEDLLGHFACVDLILLEGFKHSGFQKLEVIRGDVSQGLRLDPASVIAICADSCIEGASVPVFQVDDYSAITDYICSRIDECRANGKTQR